jgi:D-alanyl-D-alanine carboxypeptidase
VNVSRQVRPLLLALVVAAASLVGFAPVSVSAATAPPACRYDDVLTRHTAYSDWNRTLLDTIFMVGRSYVPPRLVSVSNANIGGSGRVRRFVIADLRALAAAARQANAAVRVVSAYRSYGTQATLYQREVRRFGVNRARSQVARAGHSEHQLGTTLDFGSAATAKDPWTSDWGQTKAGSWMRQNAWRFGFVMSYPRNKRSATCYRYEPWHWRYVGRDMAAAMRASGLTPRQYLWREFHQ